MKEQNELLTVAHALASNGGVVVTYRDATEVEYKNSFALMRDYSMRSGISKIIMNAKGVSATIGGINE